MPLTHAHLKAKQRELRSGFPETMGLRVHRSISWIDRAEDASDDDGRFIFLWIGFNAAYADEEEFHNAAPGERAAFASYFRKVVALDTGQRVYDAIWNNFSGPIRVLLHNRYVFNPFWQHHNGIDGYEDWEERFTASERRFARALRARDAVEVLSLVFDRLYVLRNQLVHGGASWNSRVNRDQVRDGAAILAFLMPVFVDVMMDHPGEDRGPSLLSGRGIEACSDGLGVLSRFGSGPEDRAQAWNRAGPARARLKSPAALEQALWSPRRRRERAPLPTRPPELAVWARVKLHPDCHVQFEKTYYSAAFRIVRQRLWLRATETTVHLFRGRLPWPSTHGPD